MLFPRNDSTNGWSRIIAPRTPNKPLKASIKADWIVVGGGLAGLAAARRLAENRPDDSIVLLEADRVGEGAQGRNSGFAIDAPHNVGSSMSEMAAAESHLRLARAAIAYLKEQVVKYDIQCDWQVAGKFHAAVSQNGINTVLKPTLKTLEALGEPHEWLEGKALHDKLGFDHFAAGIYTPGTVLLNPAALCHGLADSLPENVTLYEQTPVSSIAHQDGVQVCTPNGTVTGKKLILTVNGWATQFSYFKNRIIPLAAHASLTRQMTPEEQARLGGLESWGLTPANAFVGITMRRTPDQRILIRQKMAYAPTLAMSDESRAEARREHQALFDERFPMLKGVTMEHTWTGIICVSRNGAPGFGKVAENVYSAVIHNGVGLTKATAGGMLIADEACGVDNHLLNDVRLQGVPQALPPSPLFDVGLRARFQWELWRHRAEA
ncbi:FAD-binding oxidoreductase [Achromobacter sp. F4_2707]|uniref:NAD(P)/FAD-dependent oxidoreductase n=1 Tax=Achromobacter sp. F4_2707 TaxID=3114286 RepID=UPI0039C6E320